MTKSPARKLDQDARVCPWNELLEAASTWQSLVGTPLGSEELTQATLPGLRSGLGMRLMSSSADARLVASQATESPRHGGVRHR